MDTIGYLTKQEVLECLSDIMTFVTFTINGTKVHDQIVGINNQTTIEYSGEYGLFYGEGVMEYELGSFFGSHPPYRNTLDSFKNVAPTWFVVKYQREDDKFETGRQK